MEHMAWKGRIKPGCKAEYQKRHAEIWPEMVKVLKDAGICNYSIFYCNDELFGYYECEKGVAYAEKVQAESPVVDRWNEYMDLDSLMAQALAVDVDAVILESHRNWVDHSPIKSFQLSAKYLAQKF
mgnify:CR=1 FL=1